ncbi:hypothetical protein [Microbacterium sp. 77mftsu3.1]|uniref:hypothetical protein n=1 Tax=Microbacterium sp. 77mftsu3.1 TaxID=1761802 RepID=UPI00115FD840|nr:hypothetical protein [Microbacterium sp. 77mftsu3.1]
MTTKNPAAETARENHREKTTGRFGQQEHSTPEVSFHGTPVVQLDGEPTKIVLLWDETNGEYTPRSMKAAKESLGIPADESDEVLEATLTLLAPDQEYPSYVSEEPTYGDPGDDAVIPTEEWYNPVGDITWKGHADTWREDGSGYMVRGHAIIDPEVWGFAGKTAALGGIVSDAYDADERLSRSGWDVEELNDGTIDIPVSATFWPEQFTPRLVEQELNERLIAINPLQRIQDVRERGIILTDEALLASRGIDGRPVAYAALAGRVPSDAEMVAVLRAFNAKSTLTSGYAVDETVSSLPEEHRDLVTAVLNAWYKKHHQKDIAA